ncbi:MAG: hypothetical protein ACREU3_02655, partial [Steroidobacteraceae bacterium]
RNTSSSASSARDFVSDWHAAARQAEHERLGGPADDALEQARQMPAGVGSIVETNLVSAHS